MRDSFLFCDHYPPFQDLIILTHGTNQLLLEVIEGLLIKHSTPQLSKNISFAPLFLFDTVIDWLLLLFKSYLLFNLARCFALIDARI